MGKMRFDRSGKGLLSRIGSPFEITDSMRNDAYKRRKADGIFIFDAVVGKVGVNEYQDYEGSTFLEARLPEHLFDAGSMATANDASVTMLHPQWFIDEDDRYQFEKGHVVNGVYQDGIFLRAKLAIGDGDLQQRILDGEFKEISPGYYASVDQTPGVISGVDESVDGLEYDGFQHGIMYNHFAIGTHNWGRAGEQVSVVLDSKRNVVVPHFDGVINRSEKKMDEFEIVINGITYIIKCDKTSKSALEKKISDDAARISSLESELKTQSEKSDRLEGELAAEKQRADSLSDPSVMAEKVEARARLIADCKILSGKENFDSSGSDIEVMTRAIADSGLDISGKIKGKNQNFIDGLVSGIFSNRLDSAKKSASRGSFEKTVNDAGSSGNRKSVLDTAIEGL